jgi:phytoene dehydrogenase-like protein
VVEAAAHPGGAVRSEPGPLPGHVCDPCSGFFPLTRVSPAFDDVELPGVEWVEPPLAMAHPFSDGRVALLHRDLDVTVDSLERLKPGAGRAWAELVGPLLRNGQLVRRTALAGLPPAAAVPLALRLGPRALELGRLMTGSAATLGRDALGSPEAAAWLSGSAVHSDLAPDESGSGALGLFLHLLAHMVAWPFPRGGAGEITRALVERLERAGGRLRLNGVVERIECEHGRARGATLRDGEQLAADAVIATIGVAPLLRVLPRGALPEGVTRRLSRWRYGTGTFKVDYALSAPVPWRHEQLSEAAVVHVGDTLEQQIDAARAAGAGRAPSAPSLVVGQHSLHDPARGGHTLYVYAHVPADTDEGFAEVIDRRIESFAPGFAATVRGRTIRPPRRLEAENASLVGGDLSGGSVALDQQLVLRPAPRLARYRTPLRGLYVAGASTHPGPGVHGVSGAGAAAAVLADARPPRTWIRR